MSSLTRTYVPSKRSRRTSSPTGWARADEEAAAAASATTARASANGRRRGLRWCMAFLHVVLDHAGLGDEDDLLGDVGRQVGHPLEVARDEDEFDPAGDGIGFLDHVREEVAEQPALQVVDLVVLDQDVPRGGRVVAHEGVE